MRVTVRPREGQYNEDIVDRLRTFHHDKAADYIEGLEATLVILKYAMQEVDKLKALQEILPWDPPSMSETIDFQLGKIRKVLEQFNVEE